MSTQTSGTSALDRYFKISERGSTVGREVRGGIVTEEVAMRALAAEVTAEFEAHEADLADEVEEARAETVDAAIEAGPAF